MEDIVTVPAGAYYNMLGIIFVLKHTNENCKGVTSTFKEVAQYCSRYQEPIFEWHDYGQCYIEMQEIRDNYCHQLNEFILPKEFHVGVWKTIDRLFSLGDMLLYDSYVTFCQRFNIKVRWTTLREALREVNFVRSKETRYNGGIING